ncbi:putative transmembrane protein INAFM2 isoform X2 [Ostrinia furnacalis]|uniref:putative transmembrane protein INAFM2 isoform X2 n=1 Tax=Ostrinia furnacalis TaxID=93504 RepID=UPI00103945EE|nr:putative transmembrane protein INAFM2 isoform X2 [Ostrinia furnacalis]
MSVCAQTEEDSATEEMGAPIRDIYEQKSVSKVVRVLTVLAYLLSVSLAAILLSVYYVCVWKSPELPPLDDTAELAARRADPHLFGSGSGSPSFNFTAAAGGGNTTVSENATEQTIVNITEGYSNGSEFSESPSSGSDILEAGNASTPNYFDSTEGDVGGDSGDIT